MHFFKALLAGASAFAVATAQLAFTSVPTSVTAGSSYTITYSGATGPVSIILREGSASNLNTIETLTSSSTGGSFTWIPDMSLPDGSDYALQITSGSQTNYGGLFTISGGAPASMSMSSSGSMSSTAASSSTASSSMSKSTSASSSASASSSTASSSSHSSSSSSSSSSSPSTTTTSATTTAASGTSTATHSSTNSAETLSSPLAFVLCAVAAMLYLN